PPIQTLFPYTTLFRSNPGFQRHAVNVSYWNKVDANNYADEAYSSYRRFADNRTFQYFGKLTYTLNQDHSFTASVFGAPWSAGGGDRKSTRLNSSHVKI